jgi:hypothetical protein
MYLDMGELRRGKIATVVIAVVRLFLCVDEPVPLEMVGASRGIAAAWMWTLVRLAGVKPWDVFSDISALLSYEIALRALKGVFRIVR